MGPCLWPHFSGVLDTRHYPIYTFNTDLWFSHGDFRKTPPALTPQVLQDSSPFCNSHKFSSLKFLLRIHNMHTAATVHQHDRTSSVCWQTARDRWYRIAQILFQKCSIRSASVHMCFPAGNPARIPAVLPGSFHKDEFRFRSHYMEDMNKSVIPLPQEYHNFHHLW